MIFILNIMSNTQPKVAIVTGCSSGIGFETCLALGRAGYVVCATMRDINKSTILEDIAKKENIRLRTFKMDVNNDHSINNTISEIINEFGRIDVVVNNAGYALLGAIEDLSMEDIKEQFETNVFGVIRVIKKVLPRLRKQNGGTIVNISSTAGLLGFPSESIYCGTKYAVEGMSEALSYELEPFGINVVLVEPGAFNTKFVKNLVIPNLKYKVEKNIVDKKSNNQNKKELSKSPYDPTISEFLTVLFDAESKAPHPRIVANEIVIALGKITKKQHIGNLLRIPVGEDAKRYSKLKKEVNDDEFHNLLRNDLKTYAEKIR